jgi:hypothetical protein
MGNQPPYAVALNRLPGAQLGGITQSGRVLAFIKTITRRTGQRAVLLDAIDAAMDSELDFPAEYLARDLHDKGWLRMLTKDEYDRLVSTPQPHDDDESAPPIAATKSESAANDAPKMEWRVSEDWMHPPAPIVNQPAADDAERAEHSARMYHLTRGVALRRTWGLKLRRCACSDDFERDVFKWQCTCR